MVTAEELNDEELNDEGDAPGSADAEVGRCRLTLSNPR